MEDSMEDETIRRLQERINELEHRIDFVYDHLNLSHGEGVDENPQLIAAIQKGDKLEAIKIYRMITNCDLLPAKNAVEGMWNRFH
jgi:ribosomal protein L7/L12